MIKIIKQGVRKQATCENCGCMFSYEDEDIEFSVNSENSIKEECIYFRRYVACPQCKRDVDLKATR